MGVERLLVRICLVTMEHQDILLDIMGRGHHHQMAHPQDMRRHRWMA